MDHNWIWRLKGIQCVRSTCPSHNYHTKVTCTSYQRYINYTDLIRLLKVKIFFFLILFPFFLTCRCACHGVTGYMQLRLRQEWSMGKERIWKIPWIEHKINQVNKVKKKHIERSPWGHQQVGTHTTMWALNGPD